MTRVPVTRKVFSPKERVWRLLSDLEGWPLWAPLNARNRVVSNTRFGMEKGAVMSDLVEQLGWGKQSGRARSTLIPQSKIVQELTGGKKGRLTISLDDSVEGTLVRVEDSTSPTGLLSRIALALMGGDGAVTNFWHDVMAQLAGVAESPCSLERAMYCPSRMLDRYFEEPSLPMTELVNKGARQIDVKTLTVYDDERWKGIYPPDSLLPAWAFQNGFNKTFTAEAGSVKGVTSTFDDTVKGSNRLSLVDPADPAKGILLEYTDPQYMMFYDVLKVVSDELVVGKVYVGRFPGGRNLLNFTMARKYSFDFMSPQDHRELFEKYGRVPDTSKISGEWEGRMVSNASLTPPQFRFWYSVDGSGKVSCKWNYMNILRGDSKIEMTKEQMLMFDFTNFHDEIRMLRDDAMVGRYIPSSQRILDVIGDRDLGLLHFEKGAEGTRPAIYYYIKKVSDEASGSSP